MSRQFFAESFLLQLEEQSHLSLPIRSTDSKEPKRHATKLTFLELGEDIHHLICQELLDSSRASLPALSRVCKALHAVANPYIHRTLVLSALVPGLRASPKRLSLELLLKRLLAPDGDGLAKHVWHVQVQNLTDPKAVELIIEKCGNLKTFSWNAKTHIPSSILQILHNKRPAVEISVFNYRRHEADVDKRGMDEVLLSSPLVTSLDYSIYSTSRDSEWLPITRCLIAGGHCRSLRLCLTDGWRHEIPGLTASSQNFAVTSSSTFPPLEELTISTCGYGLEYSWSPDHCITLRNCMDWSSMRKLDFGDCFPQAFFEQFVGCTPNLKYLRFGYPHDQQAPIRSAIFFFRALERLEGLDVANIAPFVDAVWYGIRRMKETLRELVLRPSRTESWGQTLDIEYVKRISKKLAGLDRLGLDVPLATRPDLGKATGNGLQIPATYLLHLTTLNLKSLDLFLHLPFTATPFSAELVQNAMGSIPPPPLDVDGSRTAAIAIAEYISAAQKRPLQTLTMHFSRTGLSDRAQPYLMEAKMQLRRSERDDAASLGEDKWRVVKRSEWRGPEWWEMEDLMAFEV